MAPLGERGGRAHPGWAAACDQPAPGTLGRPERARPEARLPARRRIDRAVDRQALEHAADAALVAADAVDDLVLAAFAHLVRELGIRDLGTCHRDHVRLALGQDRLRQRGILDPADREDREPDGALDFGGELHQVAVGLVGRLDRHVDVVVAGGAHVHVVDLTVLLEQARSLDRVAGGEAARNEVAQGDPDADRPVAADPPPDSVDHLAGEPEPVLERAAVVVVSLVVDGGEELVEEVAVCDVDLRAVEAPFPRVLCAARPPLDHRVDVLLLHRLRGLAVGGRLDRRRPPEHSQVVGRVARRVQPEVVELGEDHGAVGVDARSQLAVDLQAAGEVLVREPGHAGRRGRVDKAVARDQEAGAAPRALHLVGDVPVRVDAVDREELHVRGLEDPVADGHWADLERAEEVWVPAHGILLARRRETTVQGPGGFGPYNRGGMQLAERIHLVGSGALGFDLTDPFDCHVYLLDGGDELALVDVGAGMGARAILENVRRAGFDPERIRHLVLTHAHGDHAGGAARMRDLIGGEPLVYLSATTAHYLRQGDEVGVSIDVAKTVGIYPPDYRYEPCSVDVDLREGDEVAVGDLTLRALDTPGHCDGHVSYVLDHGGERILFAGDVVFFGGKILLQAIHDCRLDEQIRSLRKLRDQEVSMLLSGHSNVSLRAAQRHIERANEILDGLLIPEQLVGGW